MIVSGKTLKTALDLSKLQMSSQFHTNHSLYQNKQKQNPLFTCTCQGNISLSFAKALLLLGTGMLVFSCCCHRKKKNKIL